MSVATVHRMQYDRLSQQQLRFYGAKKYRANNSCTDSVGMPRFATAVMVARTHEGAKIVFHRRRDDYASYIRRLATLRELLRSSYC